MEDFIQYKRDIFGFRYYFNAGINWDNGNCDEEGVSVFSIEDDGTYTFIMDVQGISVEEIECMGDKEFNEFCYEYNII